MRRSTQIAAGGIKNSALPKTQTAIATATPSVSLRRASQEATAPKPGSLRGLPRTEFLYICFIFAVTGSSAAYFVRPAIKGLLTSSDLGLTIATRIGIHDPHNASLANGPWSFRVLYFTLMMPMYSVLLFTYGTIFQRGVFFRHFLVKMWSRMMPKPLHDRLKMVLLGVVE